MLQATIRSSLLSGLLLLCACENPFAPEPHIPKGDPPPPAATSPKLLIDNLHQAMRSRKIEYYEDLLDRDFWFTETDCQGDLVLANGFEEEREIMGGSRDYSQEGIFDRFRTFEFYFFPIQLSVELASEYPEAFPGDPDGHPDEDWETIRGRVEMLLLDSNDDGFRVDQIMTYKLRLSDDGTWKIVRWIDDPLSGDCGSGKRAAGLSSWAEVKP